jgi:hypothetical protein
MTILIENADTQEYLTKDGRWTKKSQEAATYRTSTLAREFAAAAPIGRFNVIGSFKSTGQLVSLDEGVGAGAN